MIEDIVTDKQPSDIAELPGVGSRKEQDYLYCTHHRGQLRTPTSAYCISEEVGPLLCPNTLDARLFPSLPEKAGVGGSIPSLATTI
jgi:hypothetical protein